MKQLAGIMAVGAPLLLLACAAALGQSRAPAEARTDGQAPRRTSTGAEAATAPRGADKPAPAAAGSQHAPDEAAPKTFTRTDALLASLTIFVLAVFVGFEVIAKVPPTLHTPLMSGSNAVSGITIVGSILATGHGHWFISLVGTVAIVLAMINVVGGFVVTHRMLGMFRRK